MSSGPTGPSSPRLEDKVAIVTGAATGIGKGIAARLGADGAAVVVNHLPAQEEEAGAVVSGIREAGGAATPAQADISHREEFAALFDRASEAFGKIDILVNNAAIAPLTPVEDATDEQIEAVVAVNIKGTLYGCQLAAERLEDGGRIINISSSTTGLALPGYGIYDMSKGAIATDPDPGQGARRTGDQGQRRLAGSNRDRDLPDRQGPRVRRRPRAHVSVQPPRSRR